MRFVFLYPGAPKGSTGSGSGFKVSQKTGPQFKVSLNRLGEREIELRTPGYKASDLSTLPSSRPYVTFFVIASFEPLDIATSNYAGV